MATKKKKKSNGKATAAMIKATAKDILNDPKLEKGISKLGKASVKKKKRR